jgi:ADP-ribose pyrophosphatase YjhB (NUDIX family)
MNSIELKKDNIKLEEDNIQKNIIIEELEKKLNQRKKMKKDIFQMEAEDRSIYSAEVTYNEENNKVNTILINGIKVFGIEEFDTLEKLREEISNFDNLSMKRLNQIELYGCGEPPIIKSIHSIPESIIEKFSKNTNKTTDMCIVSLNDKKELVFNFGDRVYPPLGIGFAGGMVESGQSVKENIYQEIKEEMDVDIVKNKDVDSENKIHILENLETQSINIEEVRGISKTHLAFLYIENPNDLKAGDDLKGKISFTESELKKVIELNHKDKDKMSKKEIDYMSKIGYFVPHHLKILEEIILKPNKLKQIKDNIEVIEFKNKKVDFPSQINPK